MCNKNEWLWVKKHASKEFLVLIKAKNLINKERCGSRKTKECERRDHKIKLVEEIKKNIRQPDFKALVYSIVLLLRLWLGLDINISTKYVYVTKHAHTTRMKKPRKSYFWE